MANRSYLYVVDQVPGQGVPLTRVSGLSEWNWDVPLVHELLVSGSGRLVPSTIWDAPAVAILGDYDQGVANLERLFARLPQDQETQRQIAEARSVLGDPANRGRYLLLEVAEIHVLSATDDENPHPEMLREAQGMVRDTEQHVDALIRAALDLPPERLQELTGSGAWASNLYFEPSGESPPPASPPAPQFVPPAPPFGPPAGEATPPVFLTRPLANGATQWSLGLIAVIPFPFVSAITAGIVMMAAGRSRAPATEAGERNRTNAANWGLTYLLSSIILIALHIAFLITFDDTYSRSFFPIGIPITLWFAVSVTHIVFSIVGSVKASRGVVFAPIALPFFSPRLRR